MRTDHTARGFTLLEVMMALTIFAIVAVTVYGTFSRTLRSKRIAEERIDVTHSGRSAVARMGEEIAAAFYPEPKQEAAIFRSLSGGTDDVPLDALVFSALSPRPSGSAGRDSDQRVVSYFFRVEDGRMRRRAAEGGRSAAGEPAAARGRDGTPDDPLDFFAAFGPPPGAPITGTAPQQLLRRESFMTSRDALDAAPATTFLDDVVSLAFRFHDGREWLPDWDSEDRASFRTLPRAVAIDLALYDARGAVHHFTTAVDVALADTRPALSRSPGPVRPTPAAGNRSATGNARKGTR